MKTSSPVPTKSPLPSDETLTLHERIFLDMTGHALSGLCAQAEDPMDAEDGFGDRYALSNERLAERNCDLAQRAVVIGSLVTQEIFRLQNFSRRVRQQK